MKRARDALAVLLACAVAAVGIWRVQPSLAKNVYKLHDRDDVLLLPPPRELRVMTLGYHATAVDLLWADLILQYGVHWQERRSFPTVNRYINGILALEPDYQTVYLYLDTILCFTAVGAGPKEAEQARAYLERGTRARSYDPEVWLHAGQFTAFLAPSFLKDRAEMDQWRTDGAKMLLRAVELGADADRSRAAASILSRAGEKKAAIAALQRSYALTDDPDLRQEFLNKLQALDASFDAEQADSAVERQIRASWPFLKRGAGLLVGPPRSAALCAGPLSYNRPECPRDWSAVASGR